MGERGVCSLVLSAFGFWQESIGRGRRVHERDQARERASEESMQQRGDE